MNSKQVLSYAREIGKWALVFWLFLPLKNATTTPVEFGRIALGMVLFVIFTGKLLYDVVFFPRQHRAESSAGKDLLSMIGIVVGIAFLVIVVVFFVVMYVLSYMNSNTAGIH
ncbi:MAG: hypothetical protein ACE5HO_12330 [bacterium]